jgi:hypothetical protein
MLLSQCDAGLLALGLRGGWCWALSGVLAVRSVFLGEGVSLAACKCLDACCFHSVVCGCSLPAYMSVILPAHSPPPLNPQVMSRFKLPPLLDADGPDFKQLQAALMAMAEPSEWAALFGGGGE